MREIVIQCKDNTEFKELIEILMKLGCRWPDGTSLDECDLDVDDSTCSISIYVNCANKSVRVNYDDPIDALSLDVFKEALHPDPDVTMVVCRNRHEFDDLVNIVHDEGYKDPRFNYYEIYHLDDKTKLRVGVHHHSKVLTYWPEMRSDKSCISIEEFLVGIYLAAEPCIYPKGFTKADLEDNMIVETVIGTYYMYIKTADKFVRNDGFRFLSNYNDDLTASDGRNHLNIKSVYRLKDLTSFDLTTADADLIWTRSKKSL